MQGEQKSAGRELRSVWRGFSFVRPYREASRKQWSWRWDDTRCFERSV